MPPAYTYDMFESNIDRQWITYATYARRTHRQEERRRIASSKTLVPLSQDIVLWVDLWFLFTRYWSILTILIFWRRITFYLDSYRNLSKDNFDCSSSWFRKLSPMPEFGIPKIWALAPRPFDLKGPASIRRPEPSKCSVQQNLSIWRPFVCRETRRE